MLFSVLGTVLLVGTVTAIPSSPSRSLRFRSLPDIPTACQTGCAPFVDFLLGASCPLTECCLPIFQAGYFDCFGCVGNATHATDYTLAQEFVDVLTTSCNSQGFGLPELTFPGQNPGRTLATALPPDASSLPIFTSAPASATGTGSGSSFKASGSTTVRRSTTASSISRTVTPPFLSSASSHPQPQSSTVVPPLSHSTSTVASAPLSQSGAAASPGVSQSIVTSVPFTQSTVTSVPISQSTATAPPTSAGAGTPAPSSSAPSNAARAMRSKLDFDIIVAGVFLSVTILCSMYCIV